MCVRVRVFGRQGGDRTHDLSDLESAALPTELLAEMFRLSCYEAKT